MEDFFNFSLPELEVLFKERFSIAPFHARQAFMWVYKKKIRDFNLMTDLPAKIRPVLKDNIFFSSAQQKSRQISSDGTRKYLFGLGENTVEAVMIKQPTRMTLCVSSQVGCGMACAFCRTGTMGFIKNLSTSQILQQVEGVINDAKNFGDIFQNIVFMGMGEPLHNFENVSRAIRILTHQNGFEIGPRRITVSTVGLVPAIKRFAEEKVPANLAVSLNATTDEVRSKIMPINKKYPLSSLIGALKNFPTTKHKKITIEYVMLSDVNDTEADLRRLPKLLHGVSAKINLIPYNDNAGLGFKTPKRDWVHNWQKTLAGKGLEATIRWSKGQDINAACGQLVTDDKKILKKHLGYVAPENSVEGTLAI